MTEVVLNILSTALLFVGGIFCLLAAVGILVMPDVYTRMQAASKAVTLGTCTVLLAAVLTMPDIDVTARGLLVCVFLVVTVPAATHLLARAAYRSREPLGQDTVIDELERKRSLKSR